MILPIENVKLADLTHLPTTNPNVMEPHAYAYLVKGIRKYGFLQPILVVKENGATILVDGVHRKKAALEVGLVEVPAVVAKDRDQAEILRIAMNKLRGELDLSEVTRQLSLMLDVGFATEELELTGFQEWEMKALLDTQDDSHLLDDVDTSPPSTATKTFNIILKYGAESDRALVKEALEELGNGDLLTGLERALELSVPGWRDK